MLLQLMHDQKGEKGEPNGWLVNVGAARKNHIPQTTI